MADPPNVRFIDNPHAPEIFSTGHVGLWLNQGNLHITFGAGRIDHAADPGPINLVVLGRVVLSADSAGRLADGIRQLLSNPEGPPQVRPPDTPVH